MRIYAIADLHLSGGQLKPMDVFGQHWAGHFERIARDWTERVREEDLVLLPGDLSWAMYLEDALPDLRAIGALPGTKVLLRGNHDYWWNGIGVLRSALPPGMLALQNDALRVGEVILCGSRGWKQPDEHTSPEDEKIYRRELARLRLSVDRAKKLLPGKVVVMTHFPPMNDRHTGTEVTAMIGELAPCHAVYGHLHGPSLKGAFDGEMDGVCYRCVSCDALDFRLALIADLDAAAGSDKSP